MTTILNTAPYVVIEKASELTGCTRRAIEEKIAKGIWLEGYEFNRDDDGKPIIDLNGYARWVEGKRPADALPKIRSDKPARARPRVNRELKAPTALYRHFDAAGSLLYVGISLSPLARLSAHGDGSHWAQAISRVTMEWFPDRKSALDAELKAIREELPAHNIAGATRC